MARRKRSGGWGGNSSFEFEIERFLDKESGEILTEKELPENYNEDQFEYKSIVLEVEGNAYYTPGYTSGLPENCYDSESDAEIESVIDSDGKDWINSLSEDETSSIREKLIERIQNDDSDLDYDDDKYDRWKDEIDYYDY